MNNNQSSVKIISHREKRCIVCKVMWRKKDSEYCYRCDPNRVMVKYSMPSFNKLTTVQGIRKAYSNLLNAVRRHRISRDEANTMFYGLKCFIGSLREIIDMKMSMVDNKPLITDVKIEQMKLLIDKMESLHSKFKQSNTPSPSGEIISDSITNTDNVT